MRALGTQPLGCTIINLVPKPPGFCNVEESSPQFLICQHQIWEIKQEASRLAYKALYSRSLTATLHRKAVMSFIVSLKHYFSFCALRMISYAVLFICLYLAQLFHYWCKEAIQNLMINFHVNLSCLNNWWGRWAQALGVSGCYSFCLILVAVLSVKPSPPPQEHTFGEDEFPSIVSFQMGNYLNTNLCSVLQNLYIHPASHMVKYLIFA